MTISTTRRAIAKRTLLLSLLLWAGVCCVDGTSGSGGGGSTSGSGTATSLPRTTIPRSSGTRRGHRGGLDADTTTDLPPWNPSSEIDRDGFLKGVYHRIPGEWESEVRLNTMFDTVQPAHIRQVPGDGNCLFHSISLCLRYAVNGTQWDLETCLDELYHHSRSLRRRAVECLRRHPRRRLFLQGRETLRADELVEAAAQQYSLTPEEYCASMEQDSVWGGGPEIVALCNLLQRPIHVYELAVNDNDDEHDDNNSNKNDNNNNDKNDNSNKKGAAAAAVSRNNNHHHHRNHHDHRRRAPPPPCFVLRRMACFGSPRFDRRQALHILSADSRFPDLHPGQQSAVGNHFLAVFPQKRHCDRVLRKKGKRLVRGGEVLHEEEWERQQQQKQQQQQRRQEAASTRKAHGQSPHMGKKRSNIIVDDDDDDDDDECPRWYRWWRRVTFGL